jgi:predicted PurR-regulated permease PerM
MADEQTAHVPGTDWPRVAALAALTAVGVYLCYLLVFPFLPGVTWAVALAVVGLPAHRLIARGVPNPNLAAGISTTLVVLLIAVPIVLVIGQLTVEVTKAAAVVEEMARKGGWHAYASRLPYVGDALSRLDAGEVESRARELGEFLAARSLGVVGGVVGGFLQALVAIFILFFCFRDRHRILDGVRGLIPLAPPAASGVLARGRDAIHATIYGTLLVDAVQAVTGGLLFWALGLPAPLLWGVVMFVLGILPVVGAFVVWVPAAVYLATLDRWGAAVAIVAWGLVMAGPVANYLYAYIVSGRMRMHPVLILLSFLGGLAVFGISGMVLGPCVLAVTLALLDVWRHRAADGTPVAARTPAAAADGIPAG